MKSSLQCSLNDRECGCPLLWHLEKDNNTLVLVINGREFRGTVSINDQTQVTRTKVFPRQQHQVKLCLKNDLELDTGGFLSRPVLIKKKTKRKKIKVTGDKYMEVVDSTYIRILERDQTTEISIFLPYTGKSQYKMIISQTNIRHVLEVIGYHIRCKDCVGSW